ncbi:MAG: dihydropteroate synthase [Flavobacteriaceae bacterium]
MTLNCKQKLIDLTTPKVMGILNITPDSFYDGGKYKNGDTIVSQVERMLSEGATFIDVGAYSSRPGADVVPEEEELGRLTPIITLLTQHFPEILLSVDTFRAKVARACIDLGSALINDISAGHADTDMLPTIAHHQLPYIMMHMRGNPQTMQQHTDYKDLIVDIRHYFSERVSASRNLKINDLIIDPGFGFAKTMAQNFELLRNLYLLKTLNLPILVGISRKSMIYKTLGTTPQHALNGTTALHMMALQNGANILRVHDVKEAMECIKLYQMLTH